MTARRPTVAPLIAGLGTPDVSAVMPHHHRRLGDRILVTNDFGHHVLLAPADYRRFLSGEAVEHVADQEALARGGFLPHALDEASLVRAMAGRLGYLRGGPNLHVVVVTLRCDHSCRYCHATRVPMSRPGFDMTLETADKVVDTIFESPNPTLTIEFQGGEPLANFPVIRRIIERAEALNQTARRRLIFCLVSNLSLMDQDKLDYLVEHRVEICTSLDGPQPLHDAQRKTRDGTSYANACRWITDINARYAAEGLDPSLYRVEALLTVTRDALSQPREIVDAYVQAGCRAIFLRPMDPFGFASETATAIGYPIEDFLVFYREALAYIVELNRQGVQIIERYAGILLTKILSEQDPNYLDIRSPCGAGIGQLAYDQDGRIFTCDEGRMVFEMGREGDVGDETFTLGRVGEGSHEGRMQEATARAMVASSVLAAVPGCESCAYRPFCGICPVHNYTEQGSLVGRMPESSFCRRHMGILDVLFGYVDAMRTDPELASILTRWTTSRPREHFLHEAP